MIFFIKEHFGKNWCQKRNSFTNRHREKLVRQCIIKVLTLKWSRYWALPLVVKGGGKHVKVKKQRRQDILRFHADARKLILRSIGTPLDHLSVKYYLLSSVDSTYFNSYACFVRMRKWRMTL